MTQVDPGFFDGVGALTFDCYGTIVDWERGILDAFAALLGEDRPEDDALLPMFARHEAGAEAGRFAPYRSVLERVARGVGEELGRDVDGEAAARFADSVGDWPPFPDSADALRRLGGRFRLAIVSNVDDDLFMRTKRALGVEFAQVVTAQQVRSYKPARAHFDEVLRRLETPIENVVHVAQSLYHDIVPAKALGFRCVWVDRRSGRGGAGATPPAEARPDWTVHDLATLAAGAGV